MILSRFFKRQHNPHFASYYRWLVLTHHLNVKVEADSIIDVGCDDGYFLSTQVGRLKVGVDLQPRALPKNKLSVVQADGCTLPFADGSFSAVLAFDIIEHILDDDAFIASVTRVLSPGGHLWLSTPTDTAYIFPSFLMRRAMDGWGHQRVGYDVDDLAPRFPPDCRVEVTLWNTTSLSFLFVPLRVLRVISPALARLCARLCFEIDRRLPNGRDHIFLKVTRKVGYEFTR